MPEKHSLDPQMHSAMERGHIDIKLALHILENYNSGRYDRVKPVKAAGIPEIDGESIIDLRGNIDFTIEKKAATESLVKFGIDPLILDQAPEKNRRLAISRSIIEKIGDQLVPGTAFGVLNGGSASSYIDYKKNRGFHPELFALYEKEFHVIEEISRGKPKGITPAFLQPDKTPGPDFMELKIRSLCIQALRTGATTIPFFQMTSHLTDEPVRGAIEKYAQSPLLADFIQEGAFSTSHIRTGVQPLIAAYTHSKEGKTKKIFSRAYGRENSPLPMPGGHGQNFIALAPIYKKLKQEGYRFVYLTNMDNLGATIDPAALGLMALTSADAGFDFSFRTPIDIKGGILVRDETGKLNAADIGPAISFNEVLEAESKGRHILFNCATGLFNLDYLAGDLDYITNNLPVRFSDQDKDAGMYSQAEQITWEVMGLLPRPVVFGIEKYNRFLAVKILLEGLLTSGLKLDDPEFPADESGRTLKALGKKLHEGLKDKLESDYGMKLEKGRWVPKTIGELRSTMHRQGQ